MNLQLRWDLYKAKRTEINELNWCKENRVEYVQ